MTFVITYPESSFTSLGANQVRREKLRRAILQASAITDTLEDIRPSNYGASAPETMSATGRVWGFYFAGPGPSMAGSGQAALDAIVAAHNGVHVESDSPVSGGSDGQVWGWASGAPGWRSGGSGIGGALGSGDKIVPRSSGAGGSTLQASTLGIADDGRIQNAGNFSQTAAALQLNNAAVGPSLNLFQINGTAVGASAANPAAENANIAVVLNGNNETELWAYTGAAAGNSLWNRIRSVRSIFGLQLVWNSLTSLTLGTGEVIGINGALYVVSSTISLSTSTVNAPGGSDAALVASRWYYVYLIINDSGNFSAVFSLSDTAPALTGSNFTATNYRVVARVGHFRNLATATQIIEFYQTGKGNRRCYFHDDSTSAFSALTNGVATALTALGHSSGAGSLPVHADLVSLNVTTNGTAGVRMTSSSAMGTGGVVAPINSVTQQRLVPCINGVFYYTNLASSGSTTLSVQYYECEDVA